MTHRLIHVRHNFTHGEEKAPKGKKARSVPMTPDVIDALARLKDTTRWNGDDDLVFPNAVGEFEQHDKMRRRSWTALEAAGLRRIKFHDLRHAFGTAAVQHLGEAAISTATGAELRESL
ncbi:MAG: tyrosine-type recombinase/integrase [Solirubrobacterales bacterium]